MQEEWPRAPQLQQNDRFFTMRQHAFNVEQLQALNTDAIVCTYTPAEELERRVRADPLGRALSSLYELDMHVKLQTTVAAQYGVVLGRPGYSLDTSLSIHKVAEKFLTITNSP